MTDGDGRLTTYQYDLLDRLLQVTHPDTTERFVYDRDLEAEASGEPQTQNSWGRVVRTVRETAAGDFAQTFRYQAATGDPMTNTALLEQVALATPSEAFETSYEYHARSSRVLVQHYPDTTPTQPFGIRYCYDPQGAVTHVFGAEALFDCSVPGIGPEPYWKRTGIKDGLVEDEYELGNGLAVELDFDATTYRLDGHMVQGNNATVQFTYQYEPGGRLEEQVRAGQMNGTQTYGYAQNGVLETVTQDGNPVHAAEYDANMRLEAGVAGLGTFSYDSADGVSPGNRLKEVTSPDAPGEVIASFQYDGRGNQTVRQGSAIIGGEQNITYNDFNLPDTIVTGTGGSAFTVAFDYNAAGQRVHTLRPETELWHFADIYEKELRSTDPDADEVHRYWVFARGKRIAQIERIHRVAGDSWIESTKYLHFDRLGNVIAVSDESGNIVSETTYDVYGTPDQALPTAFGYTGHRHEQDLGLIDARGRFYDPKFGVFLSADPASPLSGGSPHMNRYAYVGYDPVNYTDPSGYFLTAIAAAAWQMYGNLAINALFVPALNYVVSGDFSYDWDKESWQGLGVLALSTASGVGCAAIAAPSGPAGSAIGFGLCAGTVGGGASAYMAGGGAPEVFRDALLGGIIGYVGAGTGLLTSGAAFAITKNPYVHAGITTFAGSATQVGLAAATGTEVDWARVAVQGAYSGLMAFHRAAQIDAAMQVSEAGKARKESKEMTLEEIRAHCRQLCPEPGDHAPADKSTLAGAEYSITRALHEERPRLAIRYAVAALGIEPYSVGYDSAMEEDAITKPMTLPSGKRVLTVTFGASSVEQNAAWLLSTALHEDVHLFQDAAFNWGPTGTPLFLINEVEAYSAELAAANALGLTPNQVVRVQGRWLDWYHQLSPAAQRNVTRGIYVQP